MKHSRDEARRRLSAQNYDLAVDAQVRAIADTGANYVAIGTPYDKEFLPILRLWVDGARKNGLNVWFRGNFSGWEGWFGYNKDVDREKHMEMLADFISENPNIFEDGDIFTACPECENGGPGDPRHETGMEDFRKFMIDERRVADTSFTKIDKRVFTNFNSMNLDVARRVYDRQTLEAMDNLIVFDHYVKEPVDFVNQINELVQVTGAQVVLGEVGAPLLQFTGEMDQDQQAIWVDQLFALLSRNEKIIGVNWWVNAGGESAIFSDDNEPLKAKFSLEKYFKSHDLSIINN
jgi:hypothetical protein